jgi:hypothetical protein
MQAGTPYFPSRPKTCGIDPVGKQLISDAALPNAKMPPFHGLNVYVKQCRIDEPGENPASEVFPTEFSGVPAYTPVPVEMTP